MLDAPGAEVPPPDAKKSTLVPGAIAASDWPRNPFTGGDMSETTTVAPGDYECRLLGGHDFELTVLAHDVFVVP